MNDTVDRIFEAHLTVRNIALSMACYRDRLGLEVAHVSPERVAFCGLADAAARCLDSGPRALPRNT